MLAPLTVYGPAGGPASGGAAELVPDAPVWLPAVPVLVPDAPVVEPVVPVVPVLPDFVPLAVPVVDPVDAPAVPELPDFVPDVPELPDFVPDVPELPDVPVPPNPGELGELLQAAALSPKQVTVTERKMRECIENLQKASLSPDERIPTRGTPPPRTTQAAHAALGWVSTVSGWERLTKVASRRSAKRHIPKIPLYMELR
jgi:hypothetical protein